MIPAKRILQYSDQYLQFFGLPPLCQKKECFHFCTAYSQFFSRNAFCDLDRFPLGPTQKPLHVDGVSLYGDCTGETFSGQYLIAFLDL